MSPIASFDEMGADEAARQGFANGKTPNTHGKPTLSELHIFMPETARPLVRWSNAIALNQAVEKPAVKVDRLGETELHAKSDVRFVPIAGVGRLTADYSYAA